MIEFRSIYARLGVISALNAGEKLNTKDGTISSGSVIDRLWRTITNTESRASTISYCTSVVSDSEGFMNECTDTKLKSILCEALKSSLIGLRNLQCTYGEDPNTRAQLQAIQHTIEILIHNTPPL